MPELRRREVVTLGARGFLALLAAMPFLGCSSRAGTVAQVPADPLDWQAFIDQLATLAEVQHAPAWDQSAYLAQVRTLLLRCNVGDAHVQQVIARYRNAHRTFPEIRDLHRQQTVQVCLLEFEPGERIDLHDHPDMTGCIRCVSGRVVVRNFTEVGSAATSGQVRLRHEATVTMTPGATGTLTSTTGNLHDLEAQEFTRLIDVFTPPYNDDRSRRSRWFTLGEASAAGEYTASVRG
jgi:cysteamine dioxygenase